MSCYHPNYRRYSCGYGFVEVPDDCPVCAVCNDYIWPGNDILLNADGQECHPECLEQEGGENGE